MALLTHHLSNESQLSKQSGVARSKIYDVLRDLTVKGMVFEAMPGPYVPLPPEELKKRLISQCQAKLSVLEEQLNGAALEGDRSYILTIRGYRVDPNCIGYYRLSCSCSSTVRNFSRSGARKAEALPQ
jgi:HTH-type transcriptional regulator, sugar sensing transcriptional regulator